MRVYFLLIFLIFFNLSGNCQFLEDKLAKTTTIKGLDFLYNQQFVEAEETFAKIKKDYSKHPVSFLLSAIQLQWQFLPIDKNPIALKKYIEELQKCIAASKALYKIPKYNKESTFFLLAAHGFIALTHNYNKNYLEAATEAKKAYNYFIEGKKYKFANPEFMFASGLYNYYRVQYPENHPIIKPIVLFFESGNKNQGLLDLENAVKLSIFSRTEAALYLTNINIKYESNFKNALRFSEGLSFNYPNNMIFKIKYIECLLLNSQYETAQKINESLNQRIDAVSNISYLIFDGYAQEHFHKNKVKALSQYAKALKLPRENRYTKEYHGMAFLGMARIFSQQNEISKAKIFYKNCLEVSEYEWVVQAAKKELKNLN